MRHHADRGGPGNAGAGRKDLERAAGQITGREQTGVINPPAVADCPRKTRLEAQGMAQLVESCGGELLWIACRNFGIHRGNFDSADGPHDRNVDDC